MSKKPEIKKDEIRALTLAEIEATAGAARIVKVNNKAGFRIEGRDAIIWTLS